MLELKVKEHDSLNAVIISLFGKVDTQGTETLRSKLNEYLENDSFSKIAINFSECDFITSVGLGMLVGAHKNAKENSKSLRFYELHKNIESIFKITNLYAFFDVKDSEEKALND